MKLHFHVQFGCLPPPFTQNMAATSDSRATFYSSTTINYLGGQVWQVQLIPDQIIPPDQQWQRGSVMAAINGPGDQLRQPQVIRADQLLGGGGDGLLHGRSQRNHGKGSPGPE